MLKLLFCSKVVLCVPLRSCVWFLSPFYVSGVNRNFLVVSEPNFLKFIWKSGAGLGVTSGIGESFWLRVPQIVLSNVIVLTEALNFLCIQTLLSQTSNRNHFIC